MLLHTHAVTFSSLIFSIFLLPFYLSIVLFLYKIWGPDLDNKVYYERSQNIDNIVSLSRRWEPGSHPQHHKTGWKNQYKRLICFLIFQLLRVTFPSCSLQTMKGQKLLFYCLMKAENSWFYMTSEAVALWEILNIVTDKINHMIGHSFKIWRVERCHL